MRVPYLDTADRSHTKLSLVQHEEESLTPGIRIGQDGFELTLVGVEGLLVSMVFTPLPSADLLHVVERVLVIRIPDLRNHDDERDRSSCGSGVVPGIGGEIIGAEVILV
jgi:hypothetical protein